MWSAPMAMLSNRAARWKPSPHRWGVLSVALPYWVMSSRLKLPVDGSSHVAIRCPLGPCFRQARPAVNPENRANGSIDPKPAPTTRAVAEADVEMLFTPRTRPKNVGIDCSGRRTQTRVNDESYDTQAVCWDTTARLDVVGARRPREAAVRQVRLAERLRVVRGGREVR